MQRKKILILTPFPYVDEPSMGGTVTWVTGVLEELVKYKKFDIHILTVSDSIKEYTIKKRYGVTVHYEPSPKYFPALIKGTTIDNYRLLRRIRKIKPDLVHPYITLPPYGSASLFSGFPVVLSISGVVRNEAATVKYWAAELAKKAVDTSLQLHGGAGFIKDYPISGLYDDVRIFPLFEGTSEVQLLTIAKEMIKSRIL